MDSRKIALQETRTIAIGEVVGVALMLGVFALLGKFDRSVLLGGIAGGVIAVANFFAMAMITTLAADRAEKGEVQQAQKMVQLSSTVRLVVMGLVLFLCIRMGANVVALLVPLLLERPILMLSEFFRKKVD